MQPPPRSSQPCASASAGSAGDEQPQAATPPPPTEPLDETKPIVYNMIDSEWESYRCAERRTALVDAGDESTSLVCQQAFNFGAAYFELHGWKDDKLMWYWFPEDQKEWADCPALESPGMAKHLQSVVRQHGLQHVVGATVVYIDDEDGFKLWSGSGIATNATKCRRAALAAMVINWELHAKNSSGGCKRLSDEVEIEEVITFDSVVLGRGHEFDDEPSNADADAEAVDIVDDD